MARRLEYWWRSTASGPPGHRRESLLEVASPRQTEIQSNR
jgi:hypothetical protein